MIPGYTKIQSKGRKKHAALFGYFNIFVTVFQIYIFYIQPNIATEKCYFVFEVILFDVCHIWTQIQQNGQQ